MKSAFVFILCAVVVCIADDSSMDTREVHAPIGKIRGSIIKSRLGKDIYSFRGVRYAEPPTGQQRFQVAIPARNLEETFDATEEGPSCPQVGSSDPVNEDCLRLNVYTTLLPQDNSTMHNVRRPVLVFFHPGGFYTFSGQSKIFGPQYIMDKDIVLVTVNYRLASLGFLSTGDSLAPGNLGLKDQVIALRWIRTNIAAFGGDPNAVTISGYSVGGLSVFLHLVSPMSKGLFHRAITMSGSDLTAEPFPTEQKDLAKKQAELLNCPTDTTGNMIICMNSKPVEDFAKTIGNFFEWHGDPIVIWKPVVEPEVHGVERFLPDQPVNLIRRGEFNQVPLISGVTQDEFGGVVVAFVQDAEQGNGSMFRDMNDNWNTLAPISFLYERQTTRSNYLSTQLRQFYFKDQPINTASSAGLADIYADSVIIFPAYRATRLIASYSKAPVYFYKFTYQGRYSFGMWNDTTPYGVVHHDDLQYLFYMSFRFPFLNETDPEISMLNVSTSIWSNFVQTGEPIPKHDPNLKDVQWDKFVPAEYNYLDLNLHPTMKRGFFPERMQEWEKLFPLELVH